MKWFERQNLFLGAAVLSLVLPALYWMHEDRMRQIEQEGHASLSVLQACSEIAAYANGPFSPRDGIVKQQCLLRFDDRYAAAQAKESTP